MSREHWRFRHGPAPPGPAVVFDVDGVLSDAAGRQHFLEGGRGDWKAFFDACGDDPVIEDVARLLDLLAPDLTVVLLTARPARVEPATVAWLERYRLRWDVLIMRPPGRQLASVDFKRETVRDLRDAGLEPQLAFEDDRRNVDMFQSEGVPCIYIHSGYYG